MATGIIAYVRFIVQLRRPLLLVGLLAGLVLGAPWEAWALTYTFTTINTPGGCCISAFGINNAGQIVGEYSDSQVHGFVLAGNSFTPIDAPGASDTTVYGINDAGQMVGIDNASQGPPSFLLAGGSFTPIAVPGAGLTIARGINNAGQIVGVYDSQEGTAHGFVLTGDGFSTIDVPGSSDTTVLGISNAGHIVGWYSSHGFLLAGGSFSTIDVPGAAYTVAHGVNKTGQVVGSYNDATGTHGFVLAGGSFSTIDAPGASETEVLGINDAGQIVGNYSDATGTHGFLATPGPTPFATFTATLALNLAPRIDDAFELKATATLDATSNGIDPLVDVVTLTLTGGKGGFTMTIPPGCFITNKRGDFTCKGTFGGIEVDAKITILGSKQYAVTVAGQHADLSGIANPVTVTLTIGDDSGTTTVTATWPGQDRRAATTP